jgi:hypothetical protein
MLAVKLVKCKWALFKDPKLFLNANILVDFSILKGNLIMLSSPPKVRFHKVYFQIKYLNNDWAPRCWNNFENFWILCRLQNVVEVVATATLPAGEESRGSSGRGMGAMMLANLHGLTRSRPDLLRHGHLGVTVYAMQYIANTTVFQRWASAILVRTSAIPQYCGLTIRLRNCGLKKVAELRLRTFKIWLPKCRNSLQSPASFPTLFTIICRSGNKNLR